jgi:hypothetical protein
MARRSFDNQKQPPHISIYFYQSKAIHYQTDSEMRRHSTVVSLKEPKNMPSLNLPDYKISNPAELRTPALAIYPRIVDANIEAMIRLCDSDRM